MKKLLSILLLTMLSANVAYAGFLDDIRDSLPAATKAKQMVKVEIPVNAMKKSDPRVKQIETLAIKVAMKKNWVIKVACAGDGYCNGLKQSVHKEAWRIARSKTHSDFEAKSKMPKIKMVNARGYSLRLWRKGL